MYKNNSRSSSKFNGCSPLQLSCNLTGMKPANGYYSYTNRCKAFKMRNTITLILIFISSYMNAQKINSEINRQLNIQVPIDLHTLWSDKGFDSVNRKFIYCNYGEMLFLSNSNLHEYTVSREVSGAMNESNSMYFKQKEGSITENEYRKNKELFFLDPVMTSKMVDGHLRSTYPSIKKCLVFSVSTWQEGFTYLFYGFNEKNENLGIWI